MEILRRCLRHNPEHVLVKAAAWAGYLHAAGYFLAVVSWLGWLVVALP